MGTESAIGIEGSFEFVREVMKEFVARVDFANIPEKPYRKCVMYGKFVGGSSR